MVGQDASENGSHETSLPDQPKMLCYSRFSSMPRHMIRMSLTQPSGGVDVLQAAFL